MADSYQYLTPAGVIVPDTSDLLDTVEQEYRDALGASINVKQGPQQVLIAAEVTARTNTLRNNAALANQINPDVAGGVFLDAIWRLTGGKRRAFSYSVVPAVGLTGQPGTIVPAGSLAATAAGDQFASAATVTLGAGGSASVDFIAVNPGPTPCAVAALATVVSAVLGWETVSNPTAATLGQLAESDAAGRSRRRNTLSLQNVALPEAITSALYNTAGVQSLKFRENKTSAPATIDGINLVAHSMWACVNGGADADVAAAILANATLGCDFNGASVVNVTDAASGQVYAVKFDRPTAVPLLARVTVKAVGVVGDPIALVRTAVLDYVAGLQDGEQGFVVGGNVSPFELAGAVNREAPGLYVQKVELTRAAVVNYQPAEVAMALNELPTLALAAINVVLL